MSNSRRKVPAKTASAKPAPVSRPVNAKDDDSVCHVVYTGSDGKEHRIPREEYMTKESDGTL